MIPKFNKRQKLAIAKLDLAFDKRHGADIILQFFTEKLGKVNSHVIECRKTLMNQIDVEYSDAHKEINDSGAIDVILKRLKYKEKNKK